MHHGARSGCTFKPVYAILGLLPDKFKNSQFLGLFVDWLKLLCEVLVKLARSTIDEIRRDADTIIKNEISTPSEAISDPSHLSLLREREKQRIKDEAVDKKVQRNIKAANRKRGVQKNIRDARQEVKEQYDEDPELKATIEKLERLIDQDREFIKNKNKRDRAKRHCWKSL